MNYQKVEGILYSHYRKKKRLQSLNSRLIRINNRVERLNRDIKECNIDLEDTMKAIDYSRDSIQSGGVTSNIERELERATDKILKDLEISVKEKWKTIKKIRDLEKQVENIELLLEELTEEELRIVELKYGEQLNDREVSERLYMARSTMQRKKGTIIEFIINKSK